MNFSLITFETPHELQFTRVLPNEMIVVKLFPLFAVISAVLAYSCRPCETYRGCKTKRRGNANYDFETQRWIVLGNELFNLIFLVRVIVFFLSIEPCGCEYKCQPGFSPDGSGPDPPPEIPGPDSPSAPKPLPETPEPSDAASAP